MEIEKYDSFNLIIKATPNIKIPFYQREYTWSSHEVRKLVQDIENNDVKDYYLGMIVLKSKGKYKVIIDGQQRITTLLLIFRVLLDRLVAMNSNEHVPTLERCINIEYISENLKNGAHLKTILEVNTHKMADKDFVDSIFYKNYKDLGQYFSKYTLSKLEEFYKQLKKVFIGVVFIDEKVDEFTLFEQINSTGKKLTSYDLIKNYLLSTIWNVYDENDDHKKDSKISNKLEKISSIFDHLSSESDRTNLVRHFIASITGNLVSKNGNLVYDKFKEISKNSDYFTDIDEVFNSLYEYGVAYNFIIKWKFSIYKPYLGSLKILNESFGTYATIIVDIIMNNSNIVDGQRNFNENQLNEVKKSLLVIESYFIRRLFCDYDEKTLTRYIPSLKKLIKSVNSTITYSEKLLYIIDYLPKKDKDKSYSYQMPTSDEFKESFKTFRIYRKGKFCKIFLERIGEDEYNDQSTKKFSIEHVFPQNNEKWKLENNLDDSMLSAMDSIKDTIGNLTLTHYKVNSDMSNKVFEEKVKILNSKDCFVLNKYFLNLDTWDLDAIHKRADDLYEKISQKINLDSIYKNIRDKNGDFLEFDLENEKKLMIEIEKLAYESDMETQLLKNLSSIKKIWPLNFEKVKELLRLSFIEGLSMEKNEEKIFNQSFHGFIVHSILSFLKIKRLDKKSLNFNEFEIKVKKLTPKINHLIEYIQKLIDNN